MRSGGFADGGTERRFDHDVFIVGADLLENFCGAVRVEVVDERCVEAHHQAFARWDVRRFLERLRLDGKFVVRLQRIDEVNSLPQSSAFLHLAEEGEHADVAGADSGDGTEEENHEQEGRDTQADQAKQATAAVSAATVYDSA